MVPALCVTFLTACAANPARPHSTAQGIAAPWQQQWIVAQQAAAQLDPSAMLDSIQASPDTGYTTQPPLKILFQFIRQNGELISVSFIDTDISGTTKIQAVYATTSPSAYPSSPEQKQRIVDAAASIQLSPTNLLAVTATAANPFIQQHQPSHVIMVLLFDQATIQQFGVPAVWKVMYITPNGESLQFWINPTTGAILDQYEGPL
jgi:hypothetical protein